MPDLPALRALIGMRGAAVVDSDEWISVVEAARRLGLHEATVRRRADEGHLGQVRWTKPPRGGQRRILASAVEDFRRSMLADPDTAPEPSDG